MIIDILLSLLFGALVIAFVLAITSTLNLVILNSWNINDKKPTYWDAIKKTAKEIASPFILAFKGITKKDKSVDRFPSIIMSIMMLLAALILFFSLYRQIHIL